MYYQGFASALDIEPVSVLPSFMRPGIAALVKTYMMPAMTLSRSLCARASWRMLAF